MHINIEKHWISNLGLSREFVNQFVKDIESFNDANKSDCLYSIDLLCYYLYIENGRSCPVLIVSQPEEFEDPVDEVCYLFFNKLKEFSNRCDWHIEMLEPTHWKLILRTHSECMLNKI